MVSLRKLLPGIIAFSAMSLGSISAHSAVVYQSISSLTATPNQFFCSTCSSFLPQRQYDTFTLSKMSDISGVTFNVENDDDAEIPSSLQIGFFADTGGKPGALIQSFTDTPTAASQVNTVFGERTVDTVTAPISLDLDAGAYFISFYNTNRLGVVGYSGGSGLGYVQFGSFNAEPNELLGFQLTTSVPEPATWAMLLLGFAGIGVAGYCRTKKNVSVIVA